MFDGAVQCSAERVRKRTLDLLEDLHQVLLALDHFDALRVRVVAHPELARDLLRELPARHATPPMSTTECSATNSRAHVFCNSRSRALPHKSLVCSVY